MHSSLAHATYLFADNIATASTLNNTIVSFWKMEEASGTRVDAVVASANDLTDNNTVTQATGKILKSALFTAANSEYLSISDNASLSMGAGVRMSIAGWVYFEGAVATKDIIAKFGGAGNREYILVYNATSNQFEWNVSADGTAVTTVGASTFGAASIDTWYWVYCEYDGTNIGISVNNGVLDQVAFSSDIFDGAAAFAFGTRLPTVSQYWNGRIDAYGLWKRVLTSAERTELYNGGTGKQYPF